MRKNSLKRIFAALAVSAVAATSAISMSAFAANEEDPTEAPSDETTEAPSDETTEAPSDETTEAPSDETTEAPTEAAVGPQEDGSFIFPDGQVISAADVAAAATKPVISAPKIEMQLSEVPADKIVEVTINVAGADGKFCATGVHLYFDERLTLVMDGSDVAYDTSNNSKLSWEVKAEGSTGVFAASAASSDKGKDGAYITYQFKLPDDVKAGDVFNLDLKYVSGDLFLNNAKDDAGKAMMAYAFNNIQDGYIKIADAATQAPTAAPTTAAPTTAAPTTTTGPKKDSPKTGVAGVGVAAAGLAVAAGAAFVLRKKED